MNCSICQHREPKRGGYCYMFRKKPLNCKYGKDSIKDCLQEQLFYFLGVYMLFDVGRKETIPFTEKEIRNELNKRKGEKNES